MLVLAQRAGFPGFPAITNTHPQACAGPSGGLGLGDRRRGGLGGLASSAGARLSAGPTPPSPLGIPVARATGSRDRNPGHPEFQSQKDSGTTRLHPHGHTGQVPGKGSDPPEVSL